MSYVKSSLGSDEEILIIGRFPWPFHLVAWGALIVLGIIGVGIIIWLMMLVHFKTTESALTTRRIVYKKGLFRRNTVELGVSTVEQVELNQGFWGRLFNFGIVEVSGTGDGMIRTHTIADPVRFRQLITEARSQNRTIVVESPTQEHDA